MKNTFETKIADLDRRLIETYSDASDLFEVLVNKQRELHLLDHDRPFCSFLRPQFMQRSRYEKISLAAETIAAVCDRLTEAALEKSSIMAKLSLTETEEKLARVDPGYSGTCHTSRLDTFLSGTQFKFLEYNAETPAGITDQIQMETLLKLIPEVKQFSDENNAWHPAPHEALLRALIEGYRDFGGEKENPNIAIVDWKGVATESEFHNLKEYFEKSGFSVALIDPNDLEYNGEVLSADGFVIDIFYKRVLIHEYLEKFGLEGALSRAYMDGKIFMANSFRTKIPHKKASFAVLSDEHFSFLFTEEQREAIRNHIPWTRVVEDAQTSYRGRQLDLLKLLQREREEFVLKPNDDYGGHGVKIGFQCDEKEWDDAIQLALRSPYVVQERVSVERVNIPAYANGKAEMATLLVDFDPFLFRGKVHGGLVRLSSNALINVAQGGGETALFVLED